MDTYASPLNRRINHAFMAPAIINMLLQHPDQAEADLSSLHHVYYGASPISEAVLRRSLGPSSVRLLSHGHRVPVRMAYRPRLHTVVLTPRHRLRPGTTYRIALAGATT